MLRLSVIICFEFIIGLTPIYAQAPVAVIGFSDTLVCRNDNLILQNNSINSFNYVWDFCEGDLDSIPSGVDFGVIAGASGSEDIELAQDGINWYGFIASLTNNKLIRADFGDNLNNTPTYTNLGDFGGLLVKPSGVVLLKENGNWYAFIISGSSSSTLVRLSFGNSLTNTITSEDLGNFDSNISTNYGIEFAKSDGNNLLFISNRTTRRITIINFGSSVTNNPSINDVSLIQLPAGGFFRNVALTKSKNNWFGIAVSENGNIQKLAFGNSLLNDPQISIITNNLESIYFPTDVKFLNDKGNSYAFILGRDGKLHRLNFKDELTTNFPEYLNMGNIGGFTITNGFSWVKKSSQWYVASTSASLNKLYQMQFLNNCSASFSSSSDFEPIGINYSTSGYKLISLTAYNSFGEFHYTYDSILINRGPTTRFSSSFNCVGNITEFNDSSYFDKPILSYSWNFGDPASGGSNISSAQSPLHIFSVAGIYDVTLQTTDECGEIDIRLKTIKIYTANDLSPDFLASTPTCQNSGISFIDQSTFVEDKVIGWDWDFNGEGSSNQKDPLFTFFSPGSKSVTLTVTGLSGCSYSTTKSINIEEAPTTAFSFNNVCSGQTTTFTDLTTGNNLTTWDWDFGDGTNSTNKNPTHIYPNPGKYVVTLVVGNNLSCSTTKVDTVFNHAIPVVSFTNDLPCSTAPIQFTDQSTVQDANIVAWEWNFGDGITSTDRNPQHVYGQTGDFTVQLKAYSQFSCVDSLETVLSVIQGPEVNFEWDKGCVGETTTFTDLTNSAGLPITSWTWLIDNKIFTDQNPEYIFTTAGVYPIELSVTTNNLCSQTFTLNLSIDVPPSTSYGYFESCTDNSVTFFDTTPASIGSREWRIGGSLEGIDSLLVINLQPSDYAVSLINVSEEGCTGAKLEEIPISGTLVAGFLASTNYGAIPLSVEFSNQSLGTSTYLWQFGTANDSTSTALNPAFTYTEIGNYKVTLIAYGGENCSDTITQTIEVVEPIHGFKVDAMTPIDSGKIALSLSNAGSITYNDNNSKLIFTLDNGIEFTEVFNNTLYPNNSMSYVPELTLGQIGNAQSLCVKLEFTNGLETEILDENCLSLTNDAVIASAYPNPATQYINLSVVLVDAGLVTIRLIDTSGSAVILLSDDSAEVGLNSYRIDTTPYRSGLYIIKIEAGQMVREVKVVIDK